MENADIIDTIGDGCTLKQRIVLGCNRHSRPEANRMRIKGAVLLYRIFRNEAVLIILQSMLWKCQINFPHRFFV